MCATRIAFEKQRLRSESDFDLREVATYYTRPMSPPWSQPLEVDRLADGGADIDFAVPLAQLNGLRSPRAGIGGSVRGRAHFTREQGVPVVELAMSGSVTLECQRCMKPMQLPLETATRVALIASESEAGRVPADLEPVLAAGGRVSIGELVAEELLLTLPIVPMHQGSGGCASGPQPAQAPDSTMHQPFAGLGELLKR